MNIQRNKTSSLLAILFLFFIAFFSNTSHAASEAMTCQTSKQSCPLYIDMRDLRDEIKAAIDQANADTAAGKHVDWNAIADTWGMVFTSPDDVSARLNEMYTISKNAAAYWLEYGYKYGTSMDKNLKKYLQDAFGDINAVKVKVPETPPPVFGDDKDEDPSAPPVEDEPKTPVDNAAGENTGSFFDVSYMLSQIEKQIPALIRLVMAIGYLSGFIMIVLAIMKLKAYGQQTVMSSQNAQLGPSLSYFIFGTILMFLPSMVQIATNSVMPEAGDVAYGYAGASSDFGYAQLFSAIIAIIRLVGYIAFLRGWLILSKTGGHGAQPGNLGKGIIHLIGGILAINIITTWEIVRASFGFVW